MNNQKLAINVRLNTQKSKDGKLPIYVRIYVDGVKSEISTRHFIDPVHWDMKTSRVKSQSKDAAYFNGFIERTINFINQEFLKAHSTAGRISSLEIKNRFLGKEEEPLYKTILQAFDYHNLKMLEKVKAGIIVDKTLTRHKITRNKVQAFIKYQYKTKDKPLPELRLLFVTEFELYLLTVDKLHSNTAHKYIKNLKKVMNMAVGLEWIPSNPFNQFKCSYTNPEREILNQDEINIMLNKQFEIKRLEIVRDVFIFCCYTGFAYSDLYQFEYNAVMKGLDGNLWLSTNRTKTGVKESVPLLPVALEIRWDFNIEDLDRAFEDNRNTLGSLFNLQLDFGDEEE
ncbi:site-specific integrase [Fluviicola taffensis]|uniref:Tyrosine type site-specific recombinase n=1 Tax=Fluviicola taffensis (strain DSM 16823 / NCIMB 13979 / RW262) TaxID=755732 RepID=F2IF10_FLUTR|nr:site-specific integrase [Fluviicola taffensis]AEA42475.1 tyrosine type site-specific recombinase [Fluviicola taffensis DSM 16823]